MTWHLGAASVSEGMAEIITRGVHVSLIKAPDRYLDIPAMIQKQ